MEVRNDLVCHGCRPKTIHMSFATWATTKSMCAPIAQRFIATTQRWRLTKHAHRNVNFTTLLIPNNLDQRFTLRHIRRGSHESLCDYSSDSRDCCVRSCTGTNHHPECRFPQSGTFNASYFHDDQLHDVLQFPGRKLPSHLCVAGAAYSQS